MVRPARENHQPLSPVEILSKDRLAIKPASVVGACDSFVGAMVWSLAQHDSLDAALRSGVAAGSAALLNPGTELCQIEDVLNLAPQVIVRSA
jgi:6-phosphofructokinase 2